MQKHQISFVRENRVAEAEEGASLLQVEIDAGLQPDAPCGGGGTCGKCVVLIRASAREEWRSVRACQMRVHSDLEVRTPLPAQRAQILTASACASGEELSPQVERVELRVPANRPGESAAEWELFKIALREATGRDGWQASLSLSKKFFDKLVDGGASSPATATPTSFCLNCKQFRSQKLQGSDFARAVALLH